MFRKSTAVVTASVLMIFAVACGSSSFSGFFKLQGKVFLPARVAQALSRSDVTVGNAEFVVVDLEKPADAQIVATGTTDANGNYNVDVEPTSSAAVVVSGPVRVSGLLNPNKNVRKDFDGVTDIACEAGVTAVTDGSITAAELTAQRIQNLEEAAEALADEVDFNDPSSVSAAAATVREFTNDGANSAFAQ